MTENPAVALAMHQQHSQHHNDQHKKDENTVTSIVSEEESHGNISSKSGFTLINAEPENDAVSLTDSIQLKIRNRKNAPEKPEMVLEYQIESKEQREGKQAAERKAKYESWKRMLLLIIAITVHNIPGTICFKLLSIYLICVHCEHWLI